MRATRVNEASAVSENHEAVFRVYLFESGTDAPGGSADTFDLVGADILQAIDWAQRKASPSGTYSIALRRGPETSAELDWLVGCDGNDAGVPALAPVMRRMLQRRDSRVRLAEFDHFHG